MKRFVCIVLAASALLAAAFVPSKASAGGFYLMDRGVRAGGRGGAFVAGADDPESLYYNPAGLRYSGRQLLFDAALPLMAHLEITVWDDLLEIRLDDKQIFAGAVKHRQDVGPYVGFGTSDALDARFKVGFQNFKLQKLDELPDSLKKEVVQ